MDTDTRVRYIWFAEVQLFTVYTISLIFLQNKVMDTQR